MKIFKYKIYTLGSILFLFIFILKKEWESKTKNILEVGTYRERTFNIVEYETTNTIINITPYNYIDSILYLGLNHLDINNVYIYIKPLTSEVKNSFDPHRTIKAHIIGNNTQYIVWVNNMSRSELVTVLSHELIHLKQYHTNKLILGETHFTWKECIYSYDDINDIDYFKREWELEAFKESYKLESYLRDILLKK